MGRVTADLACLAEDHTLRTPLRLQRLLRDQLGWTGYVITDEGAISFSGPGYHGYT